MAAFTGRIVERLRSWRHARAQRVGVERYLSTGRRIGSPGYGEYRARELPRMSTDPGVLRLFETGQPLPGGFGHGLDERVVEYPWVFSRLDHAASAILDAGSTLNFEWIASTQLLAGKRVIVYTLSPEGTLDRPEYSYIYGDLRRTILDEEIVDSIVCISTLEHVGMDNSRFYTGSGRSSEVDRSAFRLVLSEFDRLLRPGGQLLLTIPFGRYQDLGWLQQFDGALVADLLAGFPRWTAEIDYFRYGADGWHRSTDAECGAAEYVMVEDSSRVPPVHLASYAQAVACLHFRKPT